MVSAPYGVERELSPNFIYQMEGIFPPPLLSGASPYFSSHMSGANQSNLLGEHLPNYYSSNQNSQHFFRPYAIPSRGNSIQPQRPNSSASNQGVQEPSFLRKRNERERQRVKCVNEGYTRLRNHLPSELAEKRLSKVETLRAAIRYIEYLQELLANDEDKEKSISSRRCQSPNDNDAKEEKENEMVFEMIDNKREGGKKRTEASIKREPRDEPMIQDDDSSDWNSPSEFLSESSPSKDNVLENRTF